MNPHHQVIEEGKLGYFRNEENPYSKGWEKVSWDRGFKLAKDLHQNGYLGWLQGVKNPFANDGIEKEVWDKGWLEMQVAFTEGKVAYLRGKMKSKVPYTDFRMQAWMAGWEAELSERIEDAKKSFKAHEEEE